MSLLMTNVTSLCSYKKLAGQLELIVLNAALIAFSFSFPLAIRTIFLAAIIVLIPIDKAFVG